MRVTIDVLGPVDAPYQYVRDEDSLGLSLRHGFIEMGVRRSTVTRVTREAGHSNCAPATRRSGLDRPICSG